MDSKLKLWSEYYYTELESLKQLYYENNDVSGVFCYEKLIIGVHGSNVEYDRLPEKLRNMEKTVAQMDREKLHQSISSWSEIPKAFESSFIYSHIMLHESIHILQAFTLQSSNEQVNIQRRFMDLDFAICYLHIHYGYTWKFGDRILNNQASKWITEKEPWIKKHHQRYMPLYESIQQQFLILDSKKLNVIDLIEGQAFVFQELVTDSIGRFSAHLKSTSLYKKALYYFLPKNIDPTQIQENTYVIFILFCHLSLKFGTSRYDNFNRTAVAIFLHLCTEKEKFLMMFSKRLYNDKFQDQQLVWLIEKNYQGKMNPEQIKMFLQTSYIIDAIEKEILRYFRVMVYDSSFLLGTENDFYSSTNQIYDRKMKPLFSYYKMAHKGFDSKYFIALLLSGNNEIVSDYAFSSTNEKLDAITLNSPNGRKISMEQDNAMFEILSDLRVFIQKGETYCCPKHQHCNQKSIITSCTEPTSLRIGVKELFHTELKDLVHV